MDWKIEDLTELAAEQPIFVGFKLETSLRRQLEQLGGPDQKYVSAVDSTFLRLARQGDEVWVGKLIQGGLSTDRIDDIRRNVLSIMSRLFPDYRMPAQLEVFPALLPRGD